MKIVWKGVFPAVTTKFHQDGSLDLEMFKVNIQAQKDAGVHGIIIGGTLGEASTITNEEKLTLLEAAKQITQGSIPVLLNIAESTTHAAINFAKQATEAGADGFMLLPPMRYTSDDRETLHFLNSVVKSSPLPFLIYNNPVDYKIEVTIEMFEELLKNENVQAVKESTRDLANVTRLKNKFGDRLAVLCGVDTLAMESLVMGADGWVAGLVCAYPYETVAIYEWVKAGDIQSARDVYRWFMPLLELDINTKLVQNIKLAEVATGIGTAHVREPRLPLVGEELNRVQSIIDEAMKNRPVLNLEKTLV